MSPTTRATGGLSPPTAPIFEILQKQHIFLNFFIFNIEMKKTPAHVSSKQAGTATQAAAQAHELSSLILVTNE